MKGKKKLRIIEIIILLKSGILSLSSHDKDLYTRRTIFQT